MQVVDPHIHLWDLKTHHYPWLANPGVSFVGDARELKHDYLLDDLLSDAGGIEVLKLVHVEANHDPADPVEETRWLQAHCGWRRSRAACRTASSRPWICRRTTRAAVLEAHAAFANTRGIRQILNVHENTLYDYVGRHFMHDAAVARTFRVAATPRRCRSTCSCIRRKWRMPPRSRARMHDTQFIVNHAGMFVDRSSASPAIARGATACACSPAARTSR